jgi:hypothetical protein
VDLQTKYFMLALGISHLPGRGFQHNLRSNITRLTKVKRAFRALGHELFSALSEPWFVQGGFFLRGTRTVPESAAWAVQRLDGSHERGGFDCGVPPLNQWLL